MATLEKHNKQREDNDPEFKQKRLVSFQSFFARAVRTSENPLTHPGTPACSTQTVSEAPTVTMLPIPLTPSLRAACLPSALAATTLLKPLTFLLGPASVPAAANEIMEDSLFNHATQRPMRWKERARDFFCVCDLNSSVPCNGTQIKRCPNLKALNLSPVSDSITTRRVSQV